MEETQVYICRKMFVAKQRRVFLRFRRSMTSCTVFHFAASRFNGLMALVDEAFCKEVALYDRANGERVCCTRLMELRMVEK